MYVSSREPAQRPPDWYHCTRYLMNVDAREHKRLVQAIEDEFSDGLSQKIMWVGPHQRFDWLARRFSLVYSVMFCVWQPSGDDAKRQQRLRNSVEG